MKRTWLYVRLAAAVLLGLLIGRTYLRSGFVAEAPARHEPTPVASSARAPSPPSIPAVAKSAHATPPPAFHLTPRQYPTVNPIQGEAIRRFWQLTKVIFRAMGAKPPPPIAERLATAVRSGDRGEISRAFHYALYDMSSKMANSVPAMKAYLNHPNPFVRFTAAESLYVAGDDSGYSTLIDFIKSDSTVIIPSDIPGLEGHDMDLRIQAASVLMKFRQRAAVEDVLRLRLTVNLGADIFENLIRSGVSVDRLRLTRYFESEYPIRAYGLLRVKQFLPDLVTTFENTRDEEIKLAASWALAEITGEERYIEYLVAAAEDGHASAVRFLGSLDHPLAVETLEKAVASENRGSVEFAVVNLLFNHGGGSGAAREVLMQEIRLERFMLGADLKQRIAAALRDPEIDFAVMNADRHGWQYWCVERRNWPIYNWIDEYVVKLRSDFE